METTKAKFQGLVAAYKAAKNQENQAKENGTTLASQIALMAAMAYRHGDAELTTDIESKNWKKGDAEGEYYAIRGMLSKARAVAASDLAITEGSSVSALYAEVLKRQPVSEKDIEKKAKKAIMEKTGLDQKQFNAKTIVEQARLIEQGIALVNAPEVMPAGAIEQALFNFATYHGEGALQAILDKVNQRLVESVEAETAADIEYLANTAA